MLTILALGCTKYNPRSLVCWNVVGFTCVTKLTSTSQTVTAVVMMLKFACSRKRDVLKLAGILLGEIVKQETFLLPNPPHFFNGRFKLVQCMILSPLHW